MEIPTAEQLGQEIDQLVKQMSDPVVSRDITQMQDLARQHADKEKLLELVARLENIRQEGTQAVTMTDDEEDEEMKALVAEDIARLHAEEQKLVQHIEDRLITNDPRDDRDIILEIRAGAGGDEASLFALELFRAYARYAELNGWKLHILHSSKSEQGGFKEVIAEMAGQQVFGQFKYERGVHRVQRVPETEKQGRIHTSTVTVAVLPQAEEIDVIIRPEDLRIDTYRSGGAGGQHVNKTSSAVRLTHLPTNTVVAVQDERSQHKNKEKAMKILRSRLFEVQEQKQRDEEASDRRDQVGTGDRSEKIRTYNFPQDRITDHRITQSWSDIVSVMDGQFEKIFDALKSAAREQMLASEKRKAKNA